MPKIGLVPVLSFKDPSLTDASEDHLELMNDCLWTAQTAIKVPTLKMKTAGREIPKYLVKMKYLQATGPTREAAVEKLKADIAMCARGIPELHAEDVDV